MELYKTLERISISKRHPSEITGAGSISGEMNEWEGYTRVTVMNLPSRIGSNLNPQCYYLVYPLLAESNAFSITGSYRLATEICNDRDAAQPL